MSKEIKITVVPQEVFLEEDYREVSKHFIVDCLGNRVYIHCTDRGKCQQWVNENYGVGKYTIRTNKTDKGGGEVSCKAGMNSKSFAGQKLVQIRASQGRGL